MAESMVAFPAAGQKARGALAFAAPILADFSLSYMAISGAADGPTLCVMAGIHGAEYASIDAALRFGQTLDPARVRGRVLVLPVVNTPAFWERTPFVNPRDGKNPNRSFPGNPDGSFSEALAHGIFEHVFSLADYMVDLHGGDLVEDLVPFSLVQEVGNERVDSAALGLAITFGLQYVVVQAPVGGAVAGTTVGAAASRGIPAILPEAGGIGQLTSAAVDLHLRGLDRVLQRTGMLDGEPSPLPEPTVIRRFNWQTAERGGFFRKTIAAGDSVNEGAVIGEMVDLYGDPLAEIRSTSSGVVLFVTTSPAIQDGGLLVGVGVPS